MPRSGSVGAASEAELLVGKQALEGVLRDVEAVDVTGLRVPRASRAGMVRLILARLLVLESEVDAICEELSAARGRKLKAALKRLPELCRAMLYAQGRYAAALAETDDAASETQLDVVRQWRAPSMKLLGQLESLGHVDSKIAAHIRSGRGHEDAAQDAVELSNIFDEHWAVVEVLQSVQRDAAQRITREVIAAQQAAGLKYLEAREDQDAKLPVEERRALWARTTTALQALIVQDWDEVRLDAEFAFRHQRRDAAAFSDLVSVDALLLREA